MHAVKFYRRYWAAIDGLIFVALAFFVGLFGHQVPALQRFMVLMYMALIFHQFEEYIFPGGFPAAANIGLFGEKDNVDKYPLNEMSALLVNVFCAFPVVAFSTILLPILSFRKKDTPYGFAQYQADEFEVRHGIASLFRKN